MRERREEEDLVGIVSAFTRVNLRPISFRNRQPKAYRMPMKTLLFVLVILCAPFTQAQEKAEAIYDPQKNLTTVRFKSIQLARDKDRYHSLDFTLHYSYPGQERQTPEQVNFELVSVVKARRLNSDLYVVFVVDGKPIHFSSNRSAVRNPVPGRLWIGEKMVFLIPTEEFLKMAGSEKLAIKMGGVVFEFNDEARELLRAFADELKL